MSYVKDLRLGRLGDGDGGGRILGWMISPGDTFKGGDVLVEVETDKAVVEVEAEEDGVLVEILTQADEQAASDGTIARIEVEGDAPTEEAEPPAAEAGAAGAPVAAPPAPSSDPAPAAPPSPTVSAPPAPRAGRPERIVATPLARRIARDRGVDLGRLCGTGKRGRIHRGDVEKALQQSSVRADLPGGGRNRDKVAEDVSYVATSRGEIACKCWSPASVEAHTTVVLLHGLFGDFDVWSATANALARSGARVVAPDLPNHGRSRSSVGGFDETVRAAAEAVAATAPGSVVLCGHSFGGAVAARLACSPDLSVRSLVLIAPVGLGSEINQGFLNGMLRAGSIPAMEREVGKLTLRGAFTPGAAYLSALRERIEAHQAALGAMCRSVAWDGVQQIDIRPDLEQSGARTAIIWGRRDEILPWQHALAAPPRAALHLVPEVGHMPQWESGALILDLLRSLSGVQ